LHVRVRIGEQVVYADNRANGASPSLWLGTMPIEIPVSTILVLILLAQKNRPPVRKRGADAVAVTNPKVVGRFERRRLPGRELTRRLGPGCSSELIEWTLELRRHR